MGAQYQSADKSAGSTAENGVREFILSCMESGEFRHGERLPTERELASRFSCSRSAVRKVLTILEIEGKVARRIGSGTYVTVPLNESAADRSWPDLSLHQLIEARLALEPQLAAVAVSNATAGDLQQIEQWLQRCRKANDVHAFEQADSGFHMAVAQATHNRLLIEAYKLFGSVRKSEQWHTLKLKRHHEAPERRSIVCDEHQAIVDALRAGDQDSARARMLDHLLGVRRNLFSF